MKRYLLGLVVALSTLAVSQQIAPIDSAFSDGSKISVHELTKAQIDNLTTLGKVWGFLKYYHPAVTSGQRQWDFELFRILPKVLAAPDRDTASKAMLEWINALGPVAPCSRCAKLDRAKLHLVPDLAWISDEKTLGADLSRALQSIHANRTSGAQFYVSLVPHILNPQFDHELAYEKLKFPDFGFQLLTLYRFWNAVEYWSPYRDIIGEDWDKVLAESIPKVSLAPDGDSFKREMFVVIARMNDGHANLWGSLNLRPPTGECQLAINIRFAENQPVVSAVGTGVSELRIGDVLTEIEGVPISKLIKDWVPYYAASNEASRLHGIELSMTRGACAETAIGIRRSGQDLHVTMKRMALSQPLPGAWTHDLPGPTFRLLSKDVAYLKLSSVKASDAALYVENAAGTKGLIIDIRNYPSEFMVFALGSLLSNRNISFARFTNGDLSNPGAFAWGDTASLAPASPHFVGKVVILVDETSMSQAEYTAMAFRAAAPAAIVVGSATAGADGNVSTLPLPFGLRTMLSGIGVFYPDKKPTQRIGIIPDIVIKPTIAGIAAGRDEALEEAIRQIDGKKISELRLEKSAAVR